MRLEQLRGKRSYGLEHVGVVGFEKSGSRRGAVKRRVQERQLEVQSKSDKR